MCDFLVLAALKQECELLRKRLDGAKFEDIGARRAICGIFHGHSIALVICGLGPLNAAAAASQASGALNPKALLSVGYAGALRYGIARGDIIIADSLVLIPPLDRPYRPEANVGAPEYKPSERLFSCAMAAAAAMPIACHAGRAITVERPLCAVADKKEAGATFGAISVDMESASIARVALESSREFISIRSVSDAVGDELPDLGGDFGQGLMPKKLSIAARLAARPRLWPEVLKLRMNCAAAKKNLFLFLDNFFKIGASRQKFG